MTDITTPPPFICLPDFPDEEIHRLVEPGQTVLHPASGLFVHVGIGGDLSVTVPPITAVRLADAAEVADHQVTRGEAAVTHSVCFHGGGTLHAAHDLQSGLVELSGERVCMTFNGATGIVSVSAYRPPASEPSADSSAPE
jgi:hypothetical protein